MKSRKWDEDEKEAGDEKEAEACVQLSYIMMANDLWPDIMIQYSNLDLTL